MSEISVQPQWNAPTHVHVHCSTRFGGCSKAPFDSMNLGLHVADDRSSVIENRRIIEAQLQMPSAPVWMQQVHGVELAQIDDSDGADLITADAATTTVPDRVLTIMTADCLPVVITNNDGSRIAVAHAGWRGLASGVLQATLDAFSVDDELHAWLGPAIGAQAFEVGKEVFDAFVDVDATHAQAFKLIDSKGRGDPAGGPGDQPKYLADLYALARRILDRRQSIQLSGGGYCTFSDAKQFFSHRRDNVDSGRMATFAWIVNPGS